MVQPAQGEPAALSGPPGRSERRRRLQSGGGKQQIRSVACLVCCLLVLGELKSPYPLGKLFLVLPQHPGTLEDQPRFGISERRLTPFRQSRHELSEPIDPPIDSLIELLHVPPKPEDEIPLVVRKRPPRSLPHCRQSLAHVSQAQVISVCAPVRPWAPRPGTWRQRPAEGLIDGGRVRVAGV